MKVLVCVCGSPCIIIFHKLYLVMYLFSNNMKEVQLEEWESAQMCDVMWCDAMWCDAIKHFFFQN